jgi:disulfide bond formation protein DsbB
MDTDTVILFFALLAVTAQLAVGLAVVLAVGERRSPALARARSALATEVGPQALGLAAAVAGVAAAGSLYLSEVAGYPPCRLCWYQRYAMYPLVPILAVAAVVGSRRTRWVRWARWVRRMRRGGIVLATAGAAISVWHIGVERNPDLEGGACDIANPCSIMWVERFGYLTVPTMALSGFALVITLSAAARPTLAEEAP